MKKDKLQELRKYAADLSGIYGMQDFTYNEGKAKGMRAITLRNGRGLMATLLPDRCLDIPYFQYKDINLGLVLKPGLCAPSYFAEDGARGFLKQFNGGLLTTCGLSNAGAPCEAEGRSHGLHGVISNIPGENVNKEELEENGDIVLQVSGEMREACVFGEYVVLRRRIKMETERNRLIIIDTVENRGFSPAPLINLYHINFGYPLLDAGARVYFSTSEVAPRDKVAEKGMPKYGLIEEPEVDKAEECFIHTGGHGAQFSLLHNEKLGLAAVVHYDGDAMPYFNEWKCMAAGDYALGLEPSVAGFWGRAYAEEHNLLRYLQAGESQEYQLCIEVLDEAGAISAYTHRCKEK